MLPVKLILALFLTGSLFFGSQCWKTAPLPATMADYDPDAGYVAPYSYRLKSVEGKAVSLNKTTWQSKALLPQGFVSTAQNVLLNRETGARAALTDGSLDTPYDVRAGSGRATVRLELAPANTLYRVYVKVGAQSPVTVHVAGRKPIIIQPAQSYQWLPLAIDAASDYIELSATRHFQVFEVAALAAPPQATLIVDLERPREVGVLYLRSPQGSEAAVTISHSIDGKTYVPARAERLGNQQLIGYALAAPVRARYLRLGLPLGTEDWAKASLTTLRIYDRHGAYGPPPPAPTTSVSLRELLGVNGYWGWGGNQYSFLQAATDGPARYAGVVGHARNYHDLTWDLTDPDERIDFDRMATAGTPANAWLDWDKEYREWRKAGLPVQASLQFQRFDADEWDTPYESAYAYGHAYARHFGPTHGNGLVDRVEVGNEPWHYPAALYRTILDGMSAGLRAGDPALPVLPCALQAADPTAEDGYFQNYIGARVPAALLPRLDGLNAHAYSYAPDFFQRERAVGPEHPLSTFGEVKNMLRWRDANAPGLPVYLSEWGYDYPGPNSDCTHPVCVSPDAAVAYALRTLFYAQRLGLARATWYYFADEEKPSGLYTRSGLTEARQTGFAPKAVFVAFQQLLSRFGELRLHRVIEDGPRTYTYLLSADGQSPTHLVTWLAASPGGGETDVDHSSTDKLGAAYRWQDGALRRLPNNNTMLKSTAQPTIYVLNK